MFHLVVEIVLEGDVDVAVEVVEIVFIYVVCLGELAP